MKLYLKIAVVLLTATAACSDKSETTTEDQLKSTTWAGTFRSKDIPVDQAFSIVFWSNNDFDWYDITQTRITGTWRTSGTEVLLTFPGEETLVADCSGRPLDMLTPSSNNNYSCSLSIKQLFHQSQAGQYHLGGQYHQPRRPEP